MHPELKIERKTDLKTRDDILAELAQEPRVDAAAVAVSVKDGVVSLTGHVSSFDQKIAAEAAVKRVMGVRAIAEEIEVRLPLADVRDDGEIAERAASLLAWTITAPPGGIKVKVEHGHVTLSGQADWGYQRQDAERAVRRLAGVRGVDNLITLRSGVKQSDLEERIRKALMRNALVDAASIHVAIDGDKVTLTGQVRMWCERDAAEEAVWTSPGVREVVDRLVII
ncbi:ornithine aminotransferase [Caulobacter sp. CCUG 60055]|uniref:BON domain-containing protein n=1 Tax=Caulobacter sp. CCUG 60055 TaxID=2100090 RepID=UPI001FA6C889|nr:BON domain-containing protein [Caulobacter sp. CCUG 60055]MCI3179219.1 ornithine aminotransferase [Caulobacter sp. CCUG 60055]